MSQPRHREVEHEIKVQAPADVVYQLIAEVGHWPQIFPPSVHVEYLERSGSQERIQIWATANGAAKTWISRRELDPTLRRIEFRQERSTPPVGGMGGTWIIEPISDGECHVRLQHDYRAVDDDPAKLAWIDQAVDRNSQSELAALKTNAELAGSSSKLLLTFADLVRINGSATDVFDFINEAQRWSERLPHVARVKLQEDSPGLQLLEMDTRTKDGSVHTTKSVRVTFPPDRIVYKQIQVPALMTLHTGQWTFEETRGGVTAISRHTVAINEANITSVLGANAGVEEARTFVRNALSANSLATLGHARDYAEARG
ncbi:MAG: aromatase/cyclase [Pseudonocardiales bacterium]